MSGAYGRFAALYDSFMSGTDYDGWVNYILDIFKRYNAEPKLILDLGCGTGSAARRFKALGYDMIGLDSSADMLSVAQSKDPDILYINQDIRAFELYGTVDAVISLCDVMNYLLVKRDLSGAFSLVNNYLNRDGLFVFDIITPYKYAYVLGDNTFARHTSNASFVWENRYYEKERVNEYRVTFFVRREDGLFERFRERHIQRAHALRTVARLLESSGLEVLGVFREKTFLPVISNTERAFFVARKR